MRPHPPYAFVRDHTHDVSLFGTTPMMCFVSGPHPRREFVRDHTHDVSDLCVLFREQPVRCCVFSAFVRLVFCVCASGFLRLCVCVGASVRLCLCVWAFGFLRLCVCVCACWVFDGVGSALGLFYSGCRFEIIWILRYSNQGTRKTRAVRSTPVGDLGSRANVETF